MAIRLEPKRPDEVRDYTHDWSAFLGEDTISTSNWTADGVTKDSDQNDDTSVTVWVSGGVDGATGRLTNTITTAGGRTESETFVIPVRNSAEPVSFVEAAAHLRLGDDISEQGLVESYITAARAWVENYTGKILVRREMTDEHVAFCRFFDLYWVPFDPETVEIGYIDTDGAAQTVSDTTINARRVYPPYNEWWPSTRTNTGVTVTYTAGYPEGEVPEPLVQAILLLVATWYNQRESASGQEYKQVPFSVVALCDQYRNVNV